MKIFFKETFKVLTAGMVIFAGLELIWPGMVIAYINLNLVLIFWFINSIIILVLTDK
ncbi:MAG: hypothetical protein WCW25_00430 [Patescibacteria group bacterium]|jgi:hypothetical protein